MPYINGMYYNSWEVPPQYQNQAATAPTYASGLPNVGNLGFQGLGPSQPNYGGNTNVSGPSSYVNPYEQQEGSQYVESQIWPGWYYDPSQGGDEEDNPSWTESPPSGVQYGGPGAGPPATQGFSTPLPPGLTPGGGNNQNYRPPGTATTVAAPLGGSPALPTPPGYALGPEPLSPYQEQQIALQAQANAAQVKHWEDTIRLQREQMAAAAAAGRQPSVADQATLAAAQEQLALARQRMQTDADLQRQQLAQQASQFAQTHGLAQQQFGLSQQAQAASEREKKQQLAKDLLTSMTSISGYMPTVDFMTKFAQLMQGLGAPSPTPAAPPAGITAPPGGLGPPPAGALPPSTPPAAAPFMAPPAQSPITGNLANVLSGLFGGSGMPTMMPAAMPPVEGLPPGALGGMTGALANATNGGPVMPGMDAYGRAI